MRDAKVFISHSNADADAALKLKRDLLANGIEAWAYESDLMFGAELDAEVRENITDADHFLLILGPEACASQWVARELGLALALRKSRCNAQPSIVGVAGNRTSSQFKVQPLDYDTGVPIGVPFDFSGKRRLNLDGQAADNVKWLANWLRPQLSVIDDPDDRDAELFEDSLTCYHDLFPDIAERDGVGEIGIWLNEARYGALMGEKWREVYAVLHVGEFAIGLFYLSVHLRRHLSFGNYLGVRRGWRQGARAEKLLQDTWLRAKDVDSDLRGVLFEVEPVDVAMLAAVAGNYRRDDPLDSSVITHLRRLRRLLLYQEHGARAFIDANGSPIWYVQPAMQEPLGTPNEVPMILMAWPDAGLDLREALAFLMDDLYGDAYGGAGSVHIPGYRDYTNALQQQMIRRAGRDWRLDRIAIPRAVSDLFRIAFGGRYRAELSL